MFACQQHLPKRVVSGCRWQPCLHANAVLSSHTVQAAGQLWVSAAAVSGCGGHCRRCRCRCCWLTTLSTAVYHIRQGLQTESKAAADTAQAWRYIPCCARSTSIKHQPTMMRKKLCCSKPVFSWFSCRNQLVPRRRCCRFCNATLAHNPHSTANCSASNMLVRPEVVQPGSG